MYLACIWQVLQLIRSQNSCTALQVTVDSLLEDVSDRFNGY